VGVEARKVITKGFDSLLSCCTNHVAQRTRASREIVSCRIHCIQLHVISFMTYIVLNKLQEKKVGALVAWKVAWEAAWAFAALESSARRRH
jgi:hypothetical protein